jgi:hypothetical protein
VPESGFKADTLIVMASHAGALTEKADLVFPMAALYEKQGSLINTYGRQKQFVQAQPATAGVQSGVDTAADIAAAVSKTKAFKAKDIASLVKKVKAGKIMAGAFKPVKAALAGKPYVTSATVLLMAMNQGMLSGSGVIKVITLQQPVHQR